MATSALTQLLTETLWGGEQGLDYLIVDLPPGTGDIQLTLAQKIPVAGAVVGNAIERASTKEEAVEVMVQLRNGERRAIVQAKGTEELRAGDPVIIVTTGGKVRVTRAPAVVPATPAGAPAQRS